MPFQLLVETLREFRRLQTQAALGAIPLFDKQGFVHDALVHQSGRVVACGYVEREAAPGNPLRLITHTASGGAPTETPMRPSQSRSERPSSTSRELVLRASV